MQNQIEGMDLRTCTDSITFDVKGVEGKVRVVGTYQAPWFSGLDVCALLEYSNSKKAIQQHVLPHQKKSLGLLSSEMRDLASCNLLGTNNFTTEYHAGKAVYINISGFKTLIKKTQMINPSNAEAIAEHPFIKQFVNYEVITMRKEQEYITAIKETFHYLTCYTQFRIDQYRLDLFIKELNLVVECDEYGHRDRDPYKEQEREDYIRDRIGCDFVRFNPDEPGFNIFKIIGDITKNYMYTRDRQAINLLEYELQNMKL